MKLGFAIYSPRHLMETQREALAKWGCREDRIYGTKEGVENLILAARRGDVVGVYGLHRLAVSWAALTGILESIERKGVEVYDLELDLPARTASVTNAKRVFAGERIFSSGDGPVERGRKGGEKAAITRTAKLNGHHKDMWRDKKKYRTNEDAALAISNAIGKTVSVPTIRRRYGASGRAGGWPGKR